MAGLELLVFLLVVTLEPVIGDYCTKYSYSYSSYSSYTTFYCDSGCCGAYNDQYCCNANVGGIIAGIVIGVIAFIVIVSVTVICCCKHQKYKGRVVQPVPVTSGGVVVVSTASTAQQAYPSPYPGYPQTPGYSNPAPYPYGSHPGMAVPPPYNQTGAYPPYNQDPANQLPSYGPATSKPPPPQPSS